MASGKNNNNAVGFVDGGFLNSVLQSVRGLVISADDEREIRDRVQDGGVHAFENYLKEKQSVWKDMPLKIGVIGLSGVGKSSFINTIRGLRPRDSGACKVGVKQITMDPAPYAHPDNENLVFWDLPGVGTPEYPKETYLKQIDFDSYDFFLILSASRFRQDDAWLGLEIAAGGKRFFYVRTKVDEDLRNEREDYGDDVNEGEVLQRIRTDLEDNLRDQPEIPIFLISNRNRSLYDFGKLSEQLINDFPQLKRDALIMTLTAISTEVIAKKVEVLGQRIWRAAILSAGAAAVPVPGCGVAVDTCILANEMVLYYDQLGLTHEALERTASLTGSDVNLLQELVEQAFPVSLLAKENIFKGVVEGAVLAGKTVAEETAKYIPITGTLIASGLSYGTIYYILNHSLEKMKKAALLVTDACVKGSIKLDDM